LNIDALILSVDDPQLDRNLRSVRKQTIPFSNIVHLNGVCPECVAFNSGMRQTTGDWVMYIGGDMILDLDALEKISKYMEIDQDDKISGYYFGLMDTFLKRKIGYLSVLRSSLYKTIFFQDNFIDDWKVVRKLRKRGWVTRKLFNFVVGTHFDQPNELQVFRRFYIHGTRFQDHRSAKGELTKLFEETGNPLYKLGVKAIEYAWIKQFYPGSHNAEFDKRAFEEFKEWMR
jgi:glycosyltransferase involved in cell wall biosynthesis